MENKNDMKAAPSVAIVMVPLPLQGHLNPLLNLSHLISTYNVPIHFVGFTTHIRQAKSRVHGWDPLSVTNIHFHEFPTPPFENPPPGPNKNNHRFPTHVVPSLRAATQLREPVNKLVQQLSATVDRIVIIYDYMMSYVVQDTTGMVPNAEAYCFRITSAFMCYSFYWEFVGKPDHLPGGVVITQVPSMEGCFPEEYSEFIALQGSAKNIGSGDIYNTSRVIDGVYLDLVAKPNWAILPFNPVMVPTEIKNEINSKQQKCLEWLDKQETNSVIFISFGTTSSLSDEEVHEIAIGLEKSDQKFIWVLRDADKGDIFDGDARKASLPQGYEERIKERGLIVRDWAPQLEILAHESTGGFLSHCGWNSILESVSMGVPIGAWPMHSDHPRNAFLITNVLKIGVEVRGWTQRDEFVPSSAVEKAVRRLMASDEGDDIRKRAEEYGDAIRRSIMNGGSSKKDMDSFVTHITRPR